MANEYNAHVRSVRGWLALIVIGWIFTPVHTSLIIHELYTRVISNGVWRGLIRPESELYSPLWLPAISLGVIGNVALSIMAIIALLFLQRRSRRMPAVAISWLLLNLLLVAADYAIASRLPGFADQPFAEFDAIKELVLAGLMAAIWIPYLLLSKSVDAVFTSEWPARLARR